MQTGETGVEFRGPPRAGQTGKFPSSLGRKPPLQGRGVLALREMCIRDRDGSRVVMLRFGKNGGVGTQLLSTAIFSVVVQPS